MNRTHRKILLSATAAAVLALSACSSQESDTPADGPNHGGSPAHGENSEQTPVFDFSMPQLGPVTVDEMSFELPQVVLDNDREYVENKMFNNISITPMQIDTPGVCGLEIAYDLHNDPVERLYQLLTNDDPSQPNYAYRPADQKNLTPEQARAKAEDAVAGSKRKPESALDLTNPEPGRYVSDDLTNAKVIGSCASSTKVDQTLAHVSYRMVGQSPAAGPGSTYGPFAEAEVGVFTNGDVFVTSTDIKGWKQDTNGDWIPN